MKIAIIGATGFVGVKILTEALDRGHDVTAIVRHPEKLPREARLTALAGDVADPGALAGLIAGHDVVISAFNPGTDTTCRGSGAIIDAVKQAGVTRLVVVGGAGSLEVAPGQLLVDQDEFPAEWKDLARKTAESLEELRREPELDWTFISPAAQLEPGARTGRYRVGGDQLMRDANGESRISLEDYAVALLDEVENPKHPRRRFSVAY